jgi:hypothetical protein
MKLFTCVMGILLLAAFVRGGGPTSAPTTQPEAAEYYLGGDAIERHGVYSITGRKITVKQAVVSAGLNIEIGGAPIYVTVVRQSGGKEETVWNDVDLQQVFAGKHKDLTLQANDVVAVNKEKKE